MDKRDKIETCKLQETNVKALRDDQLEAVTGGVLSKAFSLIGDEGPEELTLSRRIVGQPRGVIVG
jgi:hypothetical protein